MYPDLSLSDVRNGDDVEPPILSDQALRSVGDDLESPVIVET